MKPDHFYKSLHDFHQQELASRTPEQLAREAEISAWVDDMHEAGLMGGSDNRPSGLIVLMVGAASGALAGGLAVAVMMSMFGSVCGG